MEIDRLAELDKLLKKLRKTDNGKPYSDIDLIFRYLERFVSDPAIGGGSSKYYEFEIRDDPQTLSKMYTVTWKK